MSNVTGTRPRQNVYLRGSTITDGMNKWTINRVDKQFVWLEQEGTVAIPVPIHKCDQMTVLKE